MNEPSDHDLDAFEKECSGQLKAFAEPERIGGAALSLLAEPESGEALAHILAAMQAHCVGAIVRGGGRFMHYGNAAGPARLLLSTRALQGELVVDEADGVMRAGAGRSVQALAQAAVEADWELPLEATEPACTLGGTLATASTGPRAVGFGAVKDAVLGLDTTLVGGDRTRCGGRVVKNVTGYDLAKLYVGSLGTLGVIESAWLRLRPRAPTIRQLALSVSDETRGFEQALALARRGSARAVMMVAAEAAAGEAAWRSAFGSWQAPWVLLAECGGDPAAIDADLEAVGLAVESGAAEAECIEAFGRWRDGAEDHAAERSTLRVRLCCRATEVAAVAAALRAAGAEVVAQPAPGIVHGLFALDPPPVAADALDTARGRRLDEALEAVRKAANASRAVSTIEASSGWASGAVADVFDHPGPALELMRAIKRRFDPSSLLNPGRFVGGL